MKFIFYKELISLFSKLQTGKLLKETDKEEGHKKPITSLVKSVDGSHFLTGSLDKSAKVGLLVLDVFDIQYVRSSKSPVFSLIYPHFSALGYKNITTYQNICDRAPCQCSCNVSTS